MTFGRTRIELAIATVSLGMLSGCVSDFEGRGPAQTETESIDLDKTESVAVQLRMGAGELSVRGGSPKLMDGEFSFRRLAMRPQVHYDATGFRGRLRVEEPSGVHTRNSRYRWDLRFNDDKPLDLEVEFGAGEGRLELGSLNLRSADIHMGVGELRLDLRGTPKNSYTVNLRGGVGEATVYLPQGVGIVADAQGGIGGITARGLEKRDGEYVNSAYGQSRTTVRLDIRGGIGAINLIGD
ncbi:MAG TPA: toast rack family protein [Bryobacteraceae bacterium]|nr:toast rack family protein [Bryobacteraceae bacterium]